MANIASTPSLVWDPTLESSYKALIVLASIKDGDKIRIINPETPSIEIERGTWWERSLSDSSADTTLKVIHEIMQRLIVFSFQVKNSPASLSNQIISNRCSDMRTHFPKALKGVEKLYELYRQPSERKYECAAAIGMLYNDVLKKLRLLYDQESDRDLLSKIKEIEVIDPSTIARSGTQQVIDFVAQPVLHGTLSTIGSIQSFFGL